MVGRRQILFIGMLAAMAAGAAPAATPASDKQIASLDLAKAFATRSPWRLTVTQGPDVPDPIWADSWDKELSPGVVHLCLSKDGGASCDPVLAHLLQRDGKDDLFSEPHYLRDLHIVRPRGLEGPPMILIRIASAMGVTPDQRNAMHILAYDAANDRFRDAFGKMTGQTNNQEVRYIAGGPLKGDIIVADSPFGPPFSYVVTVSRPGADDRYRTVLNFRSATRYGDGNPLAVIDSEMPNILRRLGLWRAGQPLPLPDGKCPKPHMVKGALWCS